MSEQLTELTNRWREAKEREKEANRERLVVEDLILQSYGEQLRPNGTTKFDTGLKVIRQFEKKWDQEELMFIYKEFPKKSLFPFKTEFCPQADKINDLKEEHPELWELVEDALTIRERKPSFVFEE